MEQKTATETKQLAPLSSQKKSQNTWASFTMKSNCNSADCITCCHPAGKHSSSSKDFLSFTLRLFLKPHSYR